MGRGQSCGQAADKSLELAKCWCGNLHSRDYTFERLSDNDCYRYVVHYSCVNPSSTVIKDVTYLLTQDSIDDQRTHYGDW